MSWDKSTGREGVETFLMRELGISLNTLIAEAIQKGLEEKGLTFTVSEDTSRSEGDGMTTEFHPQVIQFSDGRTFVEALVQTQRGDSWGNDSYGFVEAGKDYELEREEYFYDGEDTDAPHVEKTIMPGISYSPEEIREQGGEFGPSIADFLEEHGIDGIQFDDEID